MLHLFHPKPNAGSLAIYPWKTTDVGGSFFVEGVRLAPVERIALLAAKRMPGTKFSYRTVANGVHVTRIS